MHLCIVNFILQHFTSPFPAILLVLQTTTIVGNLGSELTVSPYPSISLQSFPRRLTSPTCSAQLHSPVHRQPSYIILLPSIPFTSGNEIINHLGLSPFVTSWYQPFPVHRMLRRIALLEFLLSLDEDRWKEKDLQDWISNTHFPPQEFLIGKKNKF